MKDGSIIVIGKFSRKNPSRAYMELVGEWFLVHRDEEEMVDMLKRGGFEDINIYTDTTGVNLFAAARKWNALQI